MRTFDLIICSELKIQIIFRKEKTIFKYVYLALTLSTASLVKYIYQFNI